jgi:pilus assembly protein CpaB
MQKFTRIAALLLVVVAVVLAIAAFTLGRRHAAQPAVALVAPPSTGNTRTETTSVVAAASPLPAGQPIDASALHIVPAAHALPDGYTSIATVSGDVPLVDIPAGTQITANLLAHGVAMALKPGERALSVPVNELAGAGNRVLPGDYVDVFLSLKPNATSGYGQQKESTQARLLLSRLRVLAYGSHDLPQPKSVADAASTSDKTKASGNPQPPPRTAVLAVPVNEVNQLLLGVQDGKLSLALRSPEDAGEPDDRLFPQPRHVLSPIARLTPEQRQALDEPENQAYAGINGNGLAGRDHATPANLAHRVRRTPRVEIIRGTQAHSL